MTTERTFNFHIERYPLAATALYVAELRCSAS